MNEYDKTRAKILGVLIKDARLYAGRTVADCADLLEINETKFTQVEQGKQVLSLPDLEALTMYLKVPLDHFWGTQILSKNDQVDYSDIMNLRQQVIGGQLRRARVEAGRNHAELAELIDADEAEIASYEAGEKGVPLLQLERMGKYLGVSLDYFIDATHGPLAEHESHQKLLARFYAMPDEMRQFVCEPINQSYLETAMKLSDMDVHRLRGIAESLLDITF